MKETDQLNPISPYSITKKASEEELGDNAVILRKGTIFGVSPRMRFDLVVNAMTKTAFFNGKINYLKGIYRPLVSLETVTDTYVEALEKENGIYNVADFNISLGELADIIAKRVPKKVKVEGKEVKVERNYRADMTKFNQNFHPNPQPLQEAVDQIWEFLENNPEDKPVYYNKNI